MSETILQKIIQTTINFYHKVHFLPEQIPICSGLLVKALSRLQDVLMLEGFSVMKDKTNLVQNVTHWQILYFSSKEMLEPKIGQTL